LQGPSVVAFAENSFDGRNLLSLVSGKTPAWREFIDPPLPALIPTNFR
jgi:acetylornithine/succinyldiaminopimelate/putrescine aminotransferase